MFKLACLALALAATGCAAADTGPETRLAARDRIPAATPAGEPRTCIPLTQIRQTQVRSDEVIDFIATGRRAYRVTLPQSCPGLGFERRFSYATSLSQLCAQDIITVLYIGGGPARGASCGLAPFQPVTLARR